jgi:hypothetical protein
MSSGSLWTLPGAPSNWIGHVQVADVDSTAALTKKLGAE